MNEEVIKIKKVEGGYWGAVLLGGREQTALFFPEDKWTKDQIARRLSRYLSSSDD